MMRTSNSDPHNNTGYTIQPVTPPMIRSNNRRPSYNI
jgi:hypothetical protein